MTTTAPSIAPPDTASEAMRHAMVASQLRTNAVSDQRVVAAMAIVPREDFLPRASAALAYRDTAIPLGGGRSANPAMATGRLLNAAELRGADRVLLIGAAGGYTAALLSRIVASVVAVESEPALATHARTAVASYGNVELTEGPLPEGHAAGAPYDVLVIDGAVAQIPDALARQIRDGGRAVAGHATDGLTRLATGHRSAGGFGLVAFADIECVVLPGFDRPAAFRF